MLKEYKIYSDVLETVVASAEVSSRHSTLCGLLANRSRLSGLAHITSRARNAHRPGRIVDESYRQIAPDFNEWLNNQLDLCHGDAGKVWEFFHNQRYLLTEVRQILHYFSHDWGGDQDNFAQIRIWEEQEFPADDTFERKTWGICVDADPTERGTVCFHGRGTKVPLGKAGYRLCDIVDMKMFNTIANGWYEIERAVLSGGMSDCASSNSVIFDRSEDGGDVHPYRYPRDGQRFFDDWSASSAGRSGNRVSRHWSFDTVEHMDARNIRSFTFFLQSGDQCKVPSVRADITTPVRTLYRRLQEFDRRVGTPFSWYFYGLQGDLVAQQVLESIADGVRDGLIKLPDHDSRIMLQWKEQSYGF